MTGKTPFPLESPGGSPGETPFPRVLLFVSGSLFSDFITTHGCKNSHFRGELRRVARSRDTEGKGPVGSKWCFTWRRPSWRVQNKQGAGRWRRGSAGRGGGPANHLIFTETTQRGGARVNRRGNKFRDVKQLVPVHTAGRGVEQRGKAPGPF